MDLTHPTVIFFSFYIIFLYSLAPSYPTAPLPAAGYPQPPPYNPVYPPASNTASYPAQHNQITDPSPVYPGYPPGANSPYPPSANLGYPPVGNPAYPLAGNPGYPPVPNPAYPPQSGAYPAAGYPVQNTYPQAPRQGYPQAVYPVGPPPGYIQQRPGTYPQQHYKYNKHSGSSFGKLATGGAMATGAAASNILHKGKKSHSKKKILGGLAVGAVGGYALSRGLGGFDWSSSSDSDCDFF